MSAPELLPCPFCGGIAAMHRWLPEEQDYWQVICAACGARATGFRSLTASEAARVWNARQQNHDAAVRADERLRALDEVEAWFRAGCPGSGLETTRFVQQGYAVAAADAVAVFQQSHGLRTGGAQPT